MADKHRVVISNGEETKTFEVTTEKLVSSLSETIAQELSENSKSEFSWKSDDETTTVVIEKLGGDNGR